MSVNSSIEWTDATWNPVRGCTKVSPGCKHCYAETLSERFRGIPGHPFEFGFDLRIVPEKLLEPLSWRKSRRIFVNSMSDLFHPEIPRVFLESVLLMMELADWHIYQILTKRPKRMLETLASLGSNLSESPHAWFGVSVEDRRYGIPRIEILRDTPAAVRFLSIEPLLEDLGALDLSGIDWVIVGGESGRGARPMKEEWVLSIREQCEIAGVPFFFKQWGGVQKKKNGRSLGGRTYDAFPPSICADPPPAHAIESLMARGRTLLEKVA